MTDPVNWPRSGDALAPDGTTFGSHAGLVYGPSRPMELYSPEWWRERLLARLRARAAICEGYDEFYEGEQPLAFASKKFESVFGARYRRLPANFMPLVVDAEKERLIVQGFRFGAKPDSDKGVWRIWQDNQLDAESQIATEIALVKGVAYALVAPSPSGSPLITIEDPTETIVETAPGNRRVREAALKVWLDDDRYMRAYLYLPDVIYKWRSVNRRDNSGGYDTTRWEPHRDEGEDFPVRNQLGVVPVIPLLNRPRRDGTGRSEIAPAMGNQNAINKLRFDALVASEFVAFPQRWATNIDIPIDPDTGQPIAPFKPGVDVLWVAQRPTPEESAQYGDRIPPASFGQFPAADLAPYYTAIDNEVGAMASISRTPYHYLLGSPTSVPPTGESIKSSEAPLVRKVGVAALHFGEGWEEVMRVALVAANQPSKARTDGETIWADPETRNDAARTDSVIKQYQAGLLPDEIAWEELGYSQQQIDRIKALRAAEPVKAEADDLGPQVNAAGILIRSGFDPADALRAVGLDPIKHLGLLPVTVKDQAQLAAPAGVEDITA